MYLTQFAIFSLLSLINGSVALPIPKTGVAAVNAFDLSTSREIAALKELSAEQSNIMVVQPAQWDEVAKRISDKTNDVIASTRYSVSQMRAAKALGSVDALALWGPVQQLCKAAEEVCKKFIDMKSIVYQMNNGPVAVLGLLNALKDGSNDWTDAMTSKMPFGFNYVGEYYGSTVETAVADAIKEYKKAPPRPATSSSWF